MYAIETKDLTKKYKDMTAVNSLCLKVEEGKLLALLGVNGAGKTTTVKMLSCLTPPTSGDALICGVSIKNDPGKVKELINVSPQETAVAQKLSVRENLETSAGIYGFGKRTAKQKAQTMIKEFSLEDVAQKRAGKLSGGYQRRLSIAMALISEPKVLFLDEPTLGLDVIARRELWGVIEKLKGKMTIVLTTHYMEEAQELSDMIAIMSGGRLITTGTAEELTEKADAKNFEEAFVKIAQGGKN